MPLVETLAAVDEEEPHPTEKGYPGEAACVANGQDDQGRRQAHRAHAGVRAAAA